MLMSSVLLIPTGVSLRQQNAPQNCENSGVFIDELSSLMD